MTTRQSSYGYEELLRLRRAASCSARETRSFLCRTDADGRSHHRHQRNRRRVRQGLYPGRIRREARTTGIFPCHFIGNPVMPGCLGLDAHVADDWLLSWAGWASRASGMALSTGEVKFKGMVTPSVNEGPRIRRRLQARHARPPGARHRRRLAESRRRDPSTQATDLQASAWRRTSSLRAAPRRFTMRRSRRGQRSMRRVVVTGLGIVSSIGKRR
jgi:hypothetical protein